jgi:hypothetical protein
MALIINNPPYPPPPSPQILWYQKFAKKFQTINKSSQIALLKKIQNISICLLKKMTKFVKNKFTTSNPLCNSGLT